MHACLFIKLDWGRKTPSARGVDPKIHTSSRKHITCQLSVAGEHRMKAYREL